MNSKPYNRTFELPSAMVTATVKAQADGTIFVYFENEHLDYGITMSPQDAAGLRATIAAAESDIKHWPASTTTAPPSPDLNPDVSP